MRTHLFSRAVRTDSSPRRSENRFVFLDRVDDPFFAAVRDELDRWFEHYPHEGQSRLRDRLFGRSEPDAHAAWWELLVHELHWRQGWRATLEPSIGTRGRQPDFLLARGRERVVVEAKVVSATSDSKRAADRRRDDLYDAIDATLRSNDFVLGVNISRDGRRPVARAQLRGQVQAWLDSLNPEETLGTKHCRQHRSRTFSLADWEMVFTAFPVRESRRGQRRGSVLVARSPEGGVFAPEVAIGHAMRDKGSRYGELPHPFVIALALEEMVVHDEDVDQALFGDMVETMDEAGRVLDTHRRANGYWSETSGQRVAAVLTAQHPRPWTAARTVPRVWLNPYRTPPLKLGPWLHAKLGGDGETVEHGEPVTAAETLGLPETWPPGEAFRSQMPDPP